MGTHAAIGVRVGESIKTVYNHYDGYPNYLGMLLHAFYETEEKAIELVNLGSISQVRERVKPEPGEKHNFTNQLEDVTVAYARDSGEDIDIVHIKNLDEINYAEYIYVFEPSKGKWDTYIYTRNGWKIKEFDYDKMVKESIVSGYFSVMPEGYDRTTGERI